MSDIDSLIAERDRLRSLVAELGCALVAYGSHSNKCIASLAALREMTSADGPECICGIVGLLERARKAAAT